MASSKSERSDRRRSLAIGLLRAREAVMSHFRPILAAHDVTEQQWRVIRVLFERSPVDASELADRACVLAPSLTRIIKTLEERGTIVRERDASDGRRILLSITPQGVELIRQVTPHSWAAYRDIERRFGAERLQKLIDLLVDMAALKP